jgi:hypothetical protein
MSRYLAPRRVTPRAPAAIPAPRMLRRRALPPPPLPTASDAVLSDIGKSVEAERLRSAAT